jgi:hypothetical protein
MRRIHSAAQPTRGSTFVFSLSGTFRAAPGLRVRPAFEWDGCIVYDPNRRRLVELNLASWLLLELCDGRGFESLRSEYAASVGGRVGEGTVDEHLRSGLFRLAATGLVRRSFSQLLRRRGRIHDKRP